MRVPMRLATQFLTVSLIFESCAGPSGNTGRRLGAPERWWESGEFQALQAQAAALRGNADYAGLAGVYQKAEQYARQVGHVPARIAYLTALGNVYLLLFRYREAIDTYRRATQLAEESGDWEAAGAIAPGLVSVYLMVGDPAAAWQVSKDGLKYVARLPRRPYYEATLKLQYARLSAGSGDPGPALAAIEAARAQTPVAEGANLLSDQFEGEAEAWSILGEERLRSGDLEGAEVAFVEGFRLRRLLAPRNLFSSYRQLGALRAAQAGQHPDQREGLLREAERFTALSLATGGMGEGAFTMFRALAQRAAILRQQGKVEEALRDFAAAADLVSRWRLTLPAADSTLTAANIGLDENVFRAYAEGAAALALETGNERWLRESFLAAEQNRAVSLRQAQELVPVWRQRLPDRYWVALAEIRKEESAGLIEGRAVSRSERLHLELTEMETRFGVKSLNQSENFDGSAALTHLQQVLSKNDLLLSVQLGQARSYLWSVTQNTLHVYQLPGREEISKEVRAFRASVLEGRSDITELGSRLYKILFGQLSAFETAKASWLLSLDGPLFELPFAALWDTATAPEPAYLIERHTLQVIPGAFLIGLKSKEASTMEPGQLTKGHMPSRPAGKDVFAGFGDAVYNTADPRFDWGARGWFSRWVGPRIPGQLNRLLASGYEVDRSAETWRAGTANRSGTLVFQGRAATRQAFLRALEDARPSVIHLATHVLTGDTFKSQAFLAFSAAPGGSPELLATSDVARLSVPGALVVMTGCSSGTGDVVAGAGILGLTRAWLVAGASAVIATGWAVEDSRGDLMPIFYRRLRQESPAEALRHSQIAMIHSGNWQANPVYWASYQLTGVTQ